MALWIKSSTRLYKKIFKIKKHINWLAHNANLLSEMNSWSLFSPSLIDPLDIRYLRWWHHHPPGHPEPGDPGAILANLHFHIHHILYITHSCSLYFLNISMFHWVTESLRYFNIVSATGDINTKQDAFCFFFSLIFISRETPSLCSHMIWGRN